MKNTFLVAGGVGCVLLAWLAYSIVWVGKQSLLGTWVATPPDGSHVTLQFEGTPPGGTYKQLTKREGVVVREFGHWTIKLAELRLIMMASDIKEHPRFGVDSQYWVLFTSKAQITIDGPDRLKLIFRKAPDIPKLDFDAPKTTA